MDQSNQPRKGFRTAPQPSKGEVLQQNEQILGQLDGKIKMLSNLLMNLMQGFQALRPEVQALALLEASNATDTTAVLGDHVMIDYLGVTLNADGTPELDEAGLPNYFDGGYGTKFTIQGLGSGQLVPGFEEALVGRKAGESLDFTVTFPENYGAKQLAGKKAKFLVHIHRIYRPMADSIVETMKREYDTRKAEILKAKLEAQKQQEAAAVPAQPQAEQASEAPKAE